MHKLRPAFTEDLAARLAEGACINLVSPHGQGRRRTLADLYGCLPSSMQVLQANLRHYPQSLAAMLADLYSQAGLTDVGPDIGGFDDLLDRLPERRHATLIILHNLDELEFGEASGYDAAFFAALNATRGRDGLSLLCVTGRVHGAWLPDIGTVMLPPLTVDEILAELRRRQPPGDAGAWPGIAAWMAAQPAPYTLLEQPEDWP